MTILWCDEQMRRLVSVLIGLTLGASAIGASPTQATSPSLSPRIVGGAPSSISASPWQVLLRVNSSLCSGSVIASSWVVTAAHCVNGLDASRISAYAGITNLTEQSGSNQLAVSSVIVHPDFNDRTYQNDIALIGLAAPIIPTASVQPIALPSTVDPATWPPAGTPAQISGWGSASFGGSPSGTLLTAPIQVLSGPGQPSCGSYGSDFFPAQVICAGVPAGGIDACQGDSGGPLVVSEGGIPVIAGIVSVGNECALAQYPGLYSRVTTFLPWIKQYVPIAASAPLPPATPSAIALAGERTAIAWTQSPATGGSPITGYTATANPGSASCTTTETTCVISGLRAGVSYSFSVVATNAAGTSSAAPTSSLTRAVDAVMATGVNVRSARLATWAGLKVRSGDRVKAVSLSKQICSTTARGVRGTQQGTCVVRVSVTNQAGVARSARAYARVL